MELKLLPDKSSKLLILAGGQGTRIRSVSGDLPKCLVPIGGVPFLHYKRAKLLLWGVTHITLHSVIKAGWLRNM